MYLGKKRPTLSSENGASLAETLISVAIVAIAITTFLAAFSTGSLAVRKADKRVTAETLARSQMEYTKSQAYVAAPASYDIISPLPESYSITADATSISGRDANIQRINVTIRHGEEVLLTLEDFKLNR